MSPFGQLGSDIGIIGYQRMSYMTLHLSRYHNALMLTTPHLPRNGPLEREWIVVWSATRNKASCQSGMTINNEDPTTTTDPKIIHILFAVGQIAVVDLLMSRSGNGDMTDWWTNLEGRSKTEMRVMICDSGSNVHIRIIEWSSMIPEINL